jgi:hypothetical protein
VRQRRARVCQQQRVRASVQQRACRKGVRLAHAATGMQRVRRRGMRVAAERMRVWGVGDGRVHGMGLHQGELHDSCCQS